MLAVQGEQINGVGAAQGAGVQVAAHGSAVEMKDDHLLVG